MIMTVSLKVSPDGAYVASGSRDTAVYVWNAESARGGEVRSAVFISFDYMLLIISTKYEKVSQEQITTVSCLM